MTTTSDPDMKEIWTKIVVTLLIFFWQIQNLNDELAFTHCQLFSCRVNLKVLLEHLEKKLWIISISQDKYCVDTPYGRTLRTRLHASAPFACAHGECTQVPLFYHVHACFYSYYYNFIFFNKLKSSKLTRYQNMTASWLKLLN